MIIYNFIPLSVMFRKAEKRGMIDPINVYSVKGLNEKILYFLCVLITEVSTVFQFIPLFFVEQCTS